MITKSAFRSGCSRSTYSSSLAIHSSHCGRAASPSRSRPRRSRSWRGVSIQMENARYGRKASLEEETPSRRRCSVGCISCHSARRSVLQS
ncbi:hypothetical protein EPA93_02430 [Ktedonosporobacter rubrisoli]|uniref:Uncharacterized protein n=1 Tax=Ktedonosporobacter rubrisoli TaxID=2509675 RepID=A0A4P6JIL4_KTERU|nr:hypothetical protein EPA93_02430 [Ktedonosporobacter rubrisoli]